MCGRFANNAKKEEIEKEFKVSITDKTLTPRYNVAPSQMIDVVLNKWKTES